MTIADLLLAYWVGVAVSWVSLLIVIPISQKIADFSMPPWPETLWKLAVVAAAVNAVSLPLELVHFCVSAIAGAIVFFFLMWKWFDVDLFAAGVIVLVSWLFRVLVVNMALGIV